MLTTETAASAKEHSHESWEPDWIRYVFACVFTCNNTNCNEPVSCCGFGQARLQDYQDEEFGWGQVVNDTFTPQYFEPALVLMDVPLKCSEAVSKQLAASFSLFFADPGAALNCCRAAVEALLTDLGVKRFEITKGKRRPLPLHWRIQRLPDKYHEIKDMLLATKWLGNAGSHDGDEPSGSDARIMYDLFEHVLSEIYELKGKKLKALAKKVNKKKGPVK